MKDLGLKLKKGLGGEGTYGTEIFLEHQHCKNVNLTEIVSK